MPDTRLHRGPSPEDERAFSGDALEQLAVASVDFAWLLSRGYARHSAIKLVGTDTS